jgi:hypothetical protein
VRVKRIGILVLAAAVLAVMTGGNAFAATVWWTSGSDGSRTDGSSATWISQVSGTPNAAAGDTLKWHNDFTSNCGYGYDVDVSWSNNGEGGHNYGHVNAYSSVSVDGVSTAPSGYGGLTLQIGVSHWYGDYIYAPTRGQSYHLTS